MATLEIVYEPRMSYARWREWAFQGSGTNLAPRGTMADPDRDGLSNSLEWAFNTHPLVASGNIPSPGIGLAEPTEGNAPVVSIRYRQWLDGSGRPGIDYSTGGLTYSLQQSPSLQYESWQTLDEANISVHARDVHHGTGTETLTLHIQRPSTDDWPVFYRVRIDGGE